MPQINLHDAKTQLSRLVATAAKGEEIVIAKTGKPMARLVLLRPSARRERKPSALKGKIWVAEDFDAPLSAEEDAEIFQIKRVAGPCDTRARGHRP